MELIDRFKYIMKLNQMTASSFAEEIGVQRSSVSHILSGRNKPSLEFIQKVLNRFPKVDANWLVNGSTQVKPKSPLEEVTKDLQNELSKVEVVTKTQAETEIKDVVKANSSSNTAVEGSKKVRKVLLFYDDGTFEEFKS